MSDSDARRRQAMRIIDRITAQLSETHLVRMIDEPIDLAVETFRCPVDTPGSHHEFLSILTRFVFHIHANATACPRKLTRSQAADEAVALLEQAYEGTYTHGYHAALLDAMNAEQAGMEIVLSRVAELIKVRLRQNHRRWVFARHLDPADWPARCSVAAILLERCRNLLATIRGRTCPEQFVDDLPELFELIRGADQREGLALPGSILVAA